MTVPNQQDLDIEGRSSNDLYASEINASISWVWDGGFHAVLGNPKIARRLLPTIGDAVLWLRYAACKHLPDGDFAQKYGGFV